MCTPKKVKAADVVAPPPVPVEETPQTPEVDENARSKELKGKAKGRSGLRLDLTIGGSGGVGTGVGGLG